MTISHGILDIALQNYSIFHEEICSYKALLEIHCDAENLNFDIVGGGLQREADGKISTEIWRNVNGGKENVFDCNSNGVLRIYLPKSVITKSIYLHATILALDEFKDEFVVSCHGKILLHPRKRLFDSNRAIVSSEHKMKLKLASSLLQKEMFKVVCGWLEINVVTEIIKDENEDSPRIEDEGAMKVNETIIEEPINDQHYSEGHGFKKAGFKQPSFEEPVFKESGFKQPSFEEPGNKELGFKEPGTKVKMAPNVANIVKQTEDRNESPIGGLGIEKSYFHLPDMNAVRDILPKYHELSVKGESNLNRQRKPSVQPHVPIEEPDQSEFEQQSKKTNGNTNDQLSKGGVNNILVYQAQTNDQLQKSGGVNNILVYQAQELEKYRTIIEQMGKDINSLHKQVANLKHDKSQLSYQLTLVNSNRIEVCDENTLLGQLRAQLVTENADKMELQQRIANLQNEMIKKNEMEEAYLKLQKAHEEQQRTIHDLQNKMVKLKRLEQLCFEQENVMQVMEKKLSEIGVNTKTKHTVVTQQYDPNVAMVAETIESIDERLKLIVDLERAQNTIKALHEHIEMNARAISNGKTLTENKRLLYHYGDNSPRIKRSIITNVVPRDMTVTLPTNWRSGDKPNFSKYSYNHIKGKNIYRQDTYPY